MALHCFNLFFPCTNILQVKYADLHHRSLHCCLLYSQGGGKIRNNFATWAGQERRNVCEIFAGPVVCGHSGGREEGLSTWGLFPATLIGWNAGNAGWNAGIGPHSHTLTHQQGRGPQPNTANDGLMRKTTLQIFSDSFKDVPGSYRQLPNKDIPKDMEVVVHKEDTCLLKQELNPK